MESQVTILRPIPNVFEDYQDEQFEQSVIHEERTSVKKVTSASKGTLVYYTERVDYPENGIFMKYVDVPFPRQGFVFPEAMDAINNLKRVSVLFLAILKGKGIKGRIGNGLAHYCWIADWMFKWYDPNSKKVRKIYLQPNRYRQSVRELIRLINGFIENLGIKVYTPETGTQDFGKTIGTLIEYDNAYHWRMEDIFTETSQRELLKNPRKELSRLLKIYESREKSSIEFKAQQIVKVLRFILLIPSVKKAFRKAIENVDIEKMKMTKNDSYFFMIYDGYDQKGLSLEQRKKIWLSMTNGQEPKRVFIPKQ